MTPHHPVPRFSDLVCTPCQRTIIAGAWTTDLTRVYTRQASWPSVFSCRACRAGFARARRGMTRALPDLTSAQRDKLDALHESAHATLALVTGQPVRSVHISPSGTAHRSCSASGATDLAEPITVSVRDYVAICWAGQQAVLQRLADNHLDTPANCLDVRLLGWQDIRAALRDIRARQPRGNPTQLLLRWRAYADELVEEYRPEIDLLHHDLLEHRYLVYDLPAAAAA